MKNEKVWQPVTLQPLEAQGHVLHFWKPPINICLEPDCQGGCSVLKVCQVMLKSWGLLNKLLHTSDLKWAPLYTNKVLRSSACFGDSGTPLIVRDSQLGRYEIIGILNMVNIVGDTKCGNVQKTYFTRLSTHLSWINNQSRQSWVKIESFCGQISFCLTSCLLLIVYSIYKILFSALNGLKKLYRKGYQKLKKE